MRKVIYLALLAVVLCLGVAGGFLTMGSNDSSLLTFGSNPGLPTLEFHTTGLATTPQIPFWAGVASGEITDLCNIRVHLWKDLDSLRAILLAGKGDLWLGHSEGFAQAALQGAPVTLLVVTGWRKFYFLSRVPGENGIASLADQNIPFTPPGSPAVPVMRKLESHGAPRIRYQPFEPRRLALALTSGLEDRALVPEPLVSRLLQKAAGLKIVASVEDEYGKYTKGPARMPIAGIAVNRNTIHKHPHLVKRLAAIICKNARASAQNPERGLDSLPREFEKFISKKEVRPSLQRDLILAVPGGKAKEELRQYLTLLLPNGEKDYDSLPGEFFWK